MILNMFHTMPFVDICLMHEGYGYGVLTPLFIETSVASQDNNG
jgi:hypothetical protein